MKTYIKYLKIVFLVFIVFLLGTLAYFFLFNQEGLDRVYYSWLEKDMQKSDTSQYGFHIMTTENETGDLRILDKGLITVDKNEKKAKIVVKKSEYEYFNTTTGAGEKSIDHYKQTYFIQVVDDTVYFYYHESTYQPNPTYFLKIYDQPDLAEAINAILFSDDIAFLDGDFVDLMIQKDRPHMTPNIVARSSINANVFYKPFQIIRGDNDTMGSVDVDFDRFSISTQGSGASYTIGDGEEIERIFESLFLFNSFTITLNDTQDLYAYAYKTLTGQEYDNGLEGVDCEQMMVINFYSDRHDAEPFNLPNIK